MSAFLGNLQQTLRNCVEQQNSESVSRWCRQADSEFEANATKTMMMKKRLKDILMITFFFFFLGCRLVAILWCRHFWGTCNKHCETALSSKTRRVWVDDADKPIPNLKPTWQRQRWRTNTLKTFWWLLSSSSSFLAVDLLQFSKLTTNASDLELEVNSTKTNALKTFWWLLCSSSFSLAVDLLPFSDVGVSGELATNAAKRRQAAKLGERESTMPTSRFRIRSQRDKDKDDEQTP